MPQRAKTLQQREPRKAWAHNESAPKRLRGRALQKLRTQVLWEHRYECAECKRLGYVTTGRVEMDHIRPLSQGGTDDVSNLRPLCIEHHREKTRREAKLGRAKGRQGAKVAGG